MINYQLKTIALVVGPQGGFLTKEVETLKKLPNLESHKN